MLIVYLLIAIAFIVIMTTKFKLHPFLALLFAAFGYGLMSGMPFSQIVASVNTGFGNIVGQIGIVIVVGCIIGTFLEESGGAFIMAKSVMKLAGEKRVPLVMLILGYFVSIPVFADSGYVILTPLNKALTKKAKLSFAATAIALSLGLTLTHCLVPPTPGPIAAAAVLGADLGLVILVGFLVSTLVLVVAYFYVTRYAARTYIDPDPESRDDSVIEEVKKGPSAAKSFIPIILPLVLIVLKSVADFPTEPFGNGTFRQIIGFVGEPVVALLIGMLFAFTLPKKLELDMLSTDGWVGKSLTSAAVIIMITAAGGSFGKVLQDSGIANVLGETLASANLGIFLPFIISAALKTAQGSSTVAIVTTASLMAPLMQPLGFVTPLETTFAVISLCSGAMVISHVNDSFFWVVTQLSGLNLKMGYKLHSLGTLVCGLSAVLITWAGYMIFC